MGVGPARTTRPTRQAGRSALRAGLVEDDEPAAGADAQLGELPRRDLDRLGVRVGRRCRSGSSRAAPPCTGPSRPSTRTNRRGRTRRSTARSHLADVEPRRRQLVPSEQHPVGWAEVGDADQPAPRAAGLSANHRHSSQSSPSAVVTSTATRTKSSGCPAAAGPSPPLDPHAAAAMTSTNVAARRRPTPGHAASDRRRAARAGGGASGTRCTPRRRRPTAPHGAVRARRPRAPWRRSGRGRAGAARTRR